MAERKRNYELLVVFDLNYADSDLATEVEKLESYLKENVEDFKKEELGKREFAYPIKKKRFGYYVVYYFKAPASWVKEELEKKLYHNEALLRYFIRNLDLRKPVILTIDGKKVDVDYKKIDILKRFLSEYQKILPRKNTGLSQKYQKRIAKEIKIARIVGFLPFSAQCVES